MKCNPDLLEALVEGGMPPEQAAEVQAHAAGCASCGDELKWLRSERELMRRRAAREPLPAQKLDRLWSGVAARLAARPPARGWGRSLGFSTAVAAAAVLAFLAGRHAAEKARPTAPVEVSQAPGARYQPVVARSEAEDDIDRAEGEWRDAAAELEHVYQRERSRHHDDARLARLDHLVAMARHSIGESRRLAGRDVDARLAVLDGYSRYVRSLQTVVSDLEVAR
jgi:Putative zinc-finger